MPKPLGHKSYTSIGHLPGSRLVNNLDHMINPGQARICTVAARDSRDKIIVQEKLDGSNVAVCNIDGTLVPISRAGHTAISSPYEQHRLFAEWVFANSSMFEFLKNGERVCGEWLAQAHGTRYKLRHSPFVAFDIMFNGHERLCYDDFVARVNPYGLVIPHVLAYGPTSVEQAKQLLGSNGHHGAIDAPEGAVWRVERNGRVDFLAKYVGRPASDDGRYLPEISGKESVWNWRPDVD